MGYTQGLFWLVTAVAYKSFFLNPFYRDTTLHYYYYTTRVHVTTLLSSTYSRPVNRLHISARAGYSRGACVYTRAFGRAFVRATISNGAKKKLDEGATASPLLIIHLLIV